MIKLLRNSISLLILGALIIPEYSSARQISIQDSHPIAIVKTIDSDEPERFANPSEPGIPAGDLNGDGEMDYIQVIEGNGDLRNRDAEPDYKTVILSYNADGELVKSALLEGRYFPLGDINNDGLVDIGVQNEDGSIDVVNFSESQSEPFLEFDRYTIPASEAGNLRVGESVHNDINEDGINDALLCENSNSLFNNCLLVLGFDDPNYQVSEIPVTAFNFANQTINFSIPPRLYTSSSIAGSGNSIYAFGYTENFSSQHFYELDLNESNKLVSVLDYEWVGTSSQAISDRRIYVADIDGDQEPEIVSSDDRRFPLAGFTQIFFSDPVCDVREVDFSGETPAIQSPTVVSSNCVFDRLYQNGDGDYFAGYWQEGNYATCSASDFGTGCSDTEFYNDDQTILPCSYESCKQPIQEEGRLRNGVADPSISSRGIQTFDVLTSGLLVLRTVILIAEIQRIAEIYQTFFMIINNNPVLRTSFFRGKTQNDNTCSIQTDACELTSTVSYFVSVQNSPQEIFEVRDTESQIHGSGDLHYFRSGTIDGENDDNVLRVSITVDDSQVYSPVEFDLDFDFDFDENDKIAPYSQVDVSMDTLFPSIEVNLAPLGMFDKGFNSLAVKNIGNIDGVPGEEVLIGANSLSSGGEAVNKAWIYLGENTTYQEPDFEIDFSNDSTIGASDYLAVGRVAEGLGDINGDGIGDFAVGLPFYDQRFDGVSYGAVYVFLGQDLSVQPKSTDTTSFSEPFMVLRPTVEEGYTIGAFGSSISGGDFDGDGFNDIAVIADNGSSNPVSPTIRVYKGGAEMDALPDYFLHVTKEQVGGTSSDTLISFFDAVVAFMPEEAGADHQDLYFSPGAFSVYPDAVIFTGGNNESLKSKGIISPATSPSFTLAETGPTPTGSGVFLRNKPATGDFNGDGKYDIVVEKQFDGRDGAVSSRLLIFSPNSGIEVSNEEEQIENMLEYRLSQNYPNPFNPATNIEFRLGNSSQVTLRVYDVLGREVATLIDSEMYNKGTHQAKFDASALASGIYLYRLEAGGFIQTRKMMLIK